MSRLLLSLVIIIFPSLLVSQESILTETITAIAENIAADENDPDKVEDYSLLLWELSEDPVIINSADESEISRLFFLNEFQVKALADYVKSSGRIVSAFEIANIPGFDKEVASAMIPFISFEDQSGSAISRNFRTAFLSNFIIRPQFHDTSSPGSQWKIMSKYKFTTGHISGGIVAEKDPGEQLLYGIPSLPDYLSANLSYKGTGFIRSFIIGDFSARFGSGTAINTGFRSGMSVSKPGYMASKNEIKPWTSVGENNFFRGAAAIIGIEKLEVTMFASSNKIDCTLYEPSDSVSPGVKSLYRTGLHNSVLTLARKDILTENSYGINLSYNFANVRTGFLWTEAFFSIPFISDNSDPSGVFSFNGNRHTLLSIYYAGFIRKVMFTGEFTRGGAKSFAFVQGLSVRPHGRLVMNILLRYYSPEYTSFHGNGPGTGTSNTCQFGIQGSFTFEAARSLFISAGSDISFNPWLSYSCSFPSVSKRHEVRLRYQPSERVTAEGLLTFRYSESDNSSDPGIPSVNRIRKGSARFQIKYSPEENLVLASRIDFKRCEPSGSLGMLLLQDLNFRFRKIPLNIWMRYCVFNTDNFESALYTWENDLLYSFSIPALSGTGSRSYLMVSWKPRRNIEMRIKYALTGKMISFVSVETSEVKMQLRVSI